MKHHLLRSIVLAALALGVCTAASAGSLKVTMHDGRVTILADDVSVRQILDEWARVGQARIVNADKVFGPPVTLQLVDVPERDALDTLLRSVAGYIAAPRTAALANASLYDRVTILPTSHPPAITASAAPAPTFQRSPMPDDDMPVNMMQQQAAEQAAEQARIQQLQQQRAQQPPTSPVLMPYPGMQPPPQGQQGPVTSPRPGVPVLTSPTPGVIQQPPQPGQPGVTNPYQPTIVRPAGPGGPGGGSGGDGQ